MSGLTDLKIKAFKPEEKPYRIADGNGLYLEVKPNGVKAWRLRYRKHGINTTFAVGEYPQVSLREARQKVIELRAAIDKGEGQRPREKKELCFREVALLALQAGQSRWRPSYARTQLVRFNRYILPAFADIDISRISRKEVLELLKPLVQGGKIETAHRVLQLFNLVFDFAVLEEILETNPAAGIKKALPPVKSKPLAALTTPAKAGALLRAIDSYDGSVVVKKALLFSAYTFCRPGEIRRAEWKEFDLAAGQWIIPADKAKMNRPHTVPLAGQVRELLEELRPLTGQGRFVFPSLRTFERPMSENTITAALRKLGYSGEEMTAHGFRAMASTLLNERGHRHDVIEAQLAHAGYDKIRAVYNRAEYMEERRQLMQDWADYLNLLAWGGR